jgi:predicted nucleotidyltransferase
MPFTPYPEIDELLSSLLDQIRQILDAKLVGLYLYGSLVTGDFNREISDIDLLAATATDLDDAEFDRLQKLHLDFAEQNPAWENRIEIAYLSVVGLKTFRSSLSKIAIISPGEPFHIKEAGKDWLMNWWVVREQGRTLFGPPPTSIIDPISKDEFLQAVREHAQSWREWINDMRDRKGQAYAILTMCRALYTMRYGEQVSKNQAARWTRTTWPEWAGLIQKSLEWREAEQADGIDHAATFPETEQFVRLVIDQIVGPAGADD